MLPTVNDIRMNLSISMNCKCKLITTDIFAKEKQVIKGHVIFVKNRPSKLLISFLDFRS